MIKKIILPFWKTIKKIKKNPQLGYTILVAIVILASFIFISQQFASIAMDSQDRLVNVRVGTMQDTFVVFASNKLSEPSYIQKRIERIAIKNSTVEDFKVAQKKNNKFVTIAALNEEEVGKPLSKNTFLYNLAVSKPTESFSMEENENGKRFFNTARAITNDEGKVLGLVITKQGLSEADIQVKGAIQRSLIILVGILALVMFLFFRHSRIIDYTTLYKRIKEVDEMKDEFISMASHELRTPLTAINGYASFLEESEKIQEEEQEYAEKIRLSAKRLDGLVEDILNVSRIEQGRLTFEMEVLKPADVVESTIEDSKKTIEGKDLEISYKIKNVASIKVDRNRFRQVLDNLIGNAIKYTKEGSIKVTLDIKDNRVVIRVSDTGIGMTAEEKDKLFQKFSRIHSKKTENVSGTGLGLWITKQIVEKMNGEISVESIKGVGSHFVVSFPVAE